jgi:hypothetical protein
MAVTVNPTNIVFNDGTTQTTAAGVAPAANTVGSYAMAGVRDATNPGFVRNVTFGTNYAAGSGANQIKLAAVTEYDGGGLGMSLSNSLSGTWKWMTISSNYNLYDGPGIGLTGIACRVS